MGKTIRLRDVELRLRFDNLHITVEQVTYGVFHESITKHSHSRNYYEAHLVCGGKGSLIADGTEYPLNKGTLYMTGPNIVHAQNTDKNDLMEEYCLAFSVKRPKNSCDSEASKALLENKFWIGTDTGECESIFEKLSEESNHRSIGYQNNVKNLISSFLVALVRSYTGNTASAERAVSVPDDRRANIIDYMLLYQYATVTRRELAERLGLSERQLQRFLQKQYGKSFSQLKREARLNKARELLHEGHTYEETAAALGYGDLRSFFNMLKHL